MSARVWRLLMYVAWRLHSLVCHFVWFSLVCWGFVQGYLHRGRLCKRETLTEAELVERVEVAGALSIPVIGNILSGMFLVAGAVQPCVSTRIQSRFPCSRIMSFYFESVCHPNLVYMCGCTSGEACFGMVLPQMLFVLTISCLWAFAEPHFPIRS